MLNILAPNDNDIVQFVEDDHNNNQKKEFHYQAVDYLDLHID